MSAPSVEPPRACGPCNACCDFPAVPSLGKPVCSLCVHAGAAGCAIYEARPAECRAYRCLWLDGDVLVEDRPDLLGLVLDVPSLIEDHPDYAGVPVVCAREVAHGSSAGARAAATIARLSRSFVVRVTTYGGPTRLVGPRHLIELLAARAAARRA